ncbi:hypothetical protein ACFFLZ_17560 [Photobacterium aphoticum]|nr:hypothetical protein [Photobacterium aphoticum]GHA57817.1 hypothetical protein GCM10007086_34640 [Photobacterium aphoticum]
MNSTLYRNTVLSLLIAGVLSACASTEEEKPREFEWIAPSGMVASERTIKMVKHTCQYDEKREQSRHLVGQALEKHQEDADANEMEVNALIKQAKELLREGATCMRKQGYLTREKRS